MKDLKPSSSDKIGNLLHKSMIMRNNFIEGIKPLSIGTLIIHREVDCRLGASDDCREFLQKYGTYSVETFKEIHSHIFKSLKREKKLVRHYFSEVCQWLDEITWGWFFDKGDEKVCDFVPTPQNIIGVFVETLRCINNRDALMASVLYETQKRVGQIIELMIQQINFNSLLITFPTKNEPIVVDISPGLAQLLKNYITETKSDRRRSCLVFVTRTGLPVTRARLFHSFSKANILLPFLPKHITPDSLRYLNQRDPYKSVK